MLRNHHNHEKNHFKKDVLKKIIDRENIIQKMSNSKLTLLRIFKKMQVNNQLIRVKVLISLKR